MAQISRIDLRGLPGKGNKMTPNSATVGKMLRRTPYGVHGRWHLELVRFEPVLRFPFSHCYSPIIPSQNFKRSFVKHRNLVSAVFRA